MINLNKKIFNLSNENFKRDQRILSQVNLKKLPFKISVDNFSARYLEMFLDLKPLFKYQPGEYAMKWCLSTEKKMKVFLLIFEANEFGKEIYKENISTKLPEYSYKTVASIIDEGLDKGYYVKLAPQNNMIKNLKIRNIRPSEDLVVDFMNWNIDLISIITKFKNKYS
jgi:hypothetical protein